MTANPVRVALLRGVNVGGRNKLPMAELRESMTERGCAMVRTHLQSGNVVFRPPEGDAGAAAEVLRNVLVDEFGLNVAVRLRTAAEMNRVLERNPLGGQPTDAAKYLVGFLDQDAPEAQQPSRLHELGEERAWFVGSEIYLWCPDGVRDSKLANGSWMNRFGGGVTTRNWNTVCKLSEMAAD